MRRHLRLTHKIAKPDSTQWTVFYTGPKKPEDIAKGPPHPKKCDTIITENPIFQVIAATYPNNKNIQKKTTNPTQTTNQTNDETTATETQMTSQEDATTNYSNNQEDLLSDLTVDDILKEVLNLDPDPISRPITPMNQTSEPPTDPSTPTHDELLPWESGTGITPNLIPVLISTKPPIVQTTIKPSQITSIPEAETQPTITMPTEPLPAEETTIEPDEVTETTTTIPTPNQTPEETKPIEDEPMPEDEPIPIQDNPKELSKNLMPATNTKEEASRVHETNPSKKQDLTLFIQQKELELELLKARYELSLLN